MAAGQIDLNRARRRIGRQRRFGGMQKLCRPNRAGPHGADALKTAAYHELLLDDCVANPEFQSMSSLFAAADAPDYLSAARNRAVWPMVQLVMNPP